MIPTPAELVAALDKYVIGQDRPKRTLATAVHQHYLATAYVGPTRIKKANLLLLGPTGCLAGETLVETDNGLRRIDALRSANVRTSTGALAPAVFFWKGRSRLYRVRHERGFFSATVEHRLLVERGGVAMWRSVGELRAGDGLIERYPVPSSADHHRSIEGPSCSDVFAGDDHSARIPQGSPAGCRSSDRSCDGLPRSEEEDARASSPPLADAHAHTRQHSPSDDLAARPSRTPTCPGCGPPSTTGSPHQDSHAHGSSGYRTVHDDALLSDVSTLVPGRSVPLTSPELQALEYGPLECLLGIQASRVLSITFDRADDYFDASVPGWSNYRANGAIHHNSGKTFLCQTVARLLDVPFDSIAATAITPSGWIGSKAETVVETMYQRAKSKWGKEAFHKAQTGIAYIDEIDKLAARAGMAHGAPPGMSGDQHFNTTQIQQALLRVIEGIEIRLDGNPFPTDRILFIASGAFVGLDQIVSQREAGGKVTREVGRVNPLRALIPADLVAYGLMPEFVGRFPVTAAFDALGEQELVAIVRDVEDSLVAQKRAMLSVRGCDLEVEGAVLVDIARGAIAQGTGARGLQTKIERLLEPLLFDLPDGTLLRIGKNGVAREDRVVSGADALAPTPATAGEPAATALAQAEGSA